MGYGVFVWWGFVYVCMCITLSYRAYREQQKMKEVRGELFLVWSIARCPNPFWQSQKTCPFRHQGCVLQ